MGLVFSLVFVTAPLQQSKLESQNRIIRLAEASRGLQFSCLFKAGSSMKSDQVAQGLIQSPKAPRKETAHPLRVTSRQPLPVLECLVDENILP